MKLSIILFNTSNIETAEWGNYHFSKPQLEVVFINSLETQLNIHSERHVSETTFLKLLLPGYLSTRYKKVLYLDPDILIVRNPFQCLSKLQCPEHISGVRLRDSEGFHLPEFNAPYFNAGVMLMNLESKLVLELPKNLDDLEDIKYKFQDQDLLNLAFRFSWTEMTNKMNYFPYKSQNLSKQIPYIVHFIGPDKPWISRQPTCYHLSWVRNWNKFQKKIGQGENRISLTLKQRIFPFFWLPGGYVLLKVLFSLTRLRVPNR
jgi:lipopolysaccharide biosynthesis glycosyltransferase